jgi:hypothetical protein
MRDVASSDHLFSGKNADQPLKGRMRRFGPIDLTGSGPVIVLG